MTYIADFFSALVQLFLEMAPYLVLGFGISGILSVTLKASFVSRHVGSPGLGSSFKAALLGVPLPLCSCGVIPTAQYLKRHGASKPALMSFLISTPQTGVDSIAATYGMLGPIFAVFRPLIALVSGILGGAVSLIFGKSRSPADSRGTAEQRNPGEADGKMSLRQRAVAAYRFGFIESIDDIARDFVIGLAIAALITVAIPPGFFEGTFISDGPLAMVAMVLIGIPMYVCSTSSIPIAVALIAAGISPGAAYVFLVAGPATNAASLLVLRKVMGLRQTILYVATIVVSSLAFGPLVNWVVEGSNSLPPALVAGTTESIGVLDYLGAGALAALLTGTLVRWLQSKSRAKRKDAPTAKVSDLGSDITVLSVQGMTCEGCAHHVGSALKEIPGVSGIVVDLETGTAAVGGTATTDALIQASNEAGYPAKVETE